ncbi:MAG: 16S rRNA (adenine(1518)-N(6)/adenine(1519)-N(6))-dimethyltransferase RsmA [Candidatus Zixiibacteriota bacterium]
MSPYRAKKRFGQHFLKSDKVVASILETLTPKPGDTVVEIGPGRGTLTVPLAKLGANVIAVEFDRELVPYLKKLVMGADNIEIIHSDFLKFDPLQRGLTKFHLLGNIPYNITSSVIDWCIRYRKHIMQAVLMVQKEMALRIGGSPGSKNWSPIAIMTQLAFDVRHCFDVSPRHFNPPPKVISSVIRLSPKERGLSVPYEQFDRVLRTAFKQRRKLLANNMVPELVATNGEAQSILERLNLPPNVRAEQMSVDQFEHLTQYLNLKDKTMV